MLSILAKNSNDFYCWMIRHPSSDILRQKWIYLFLPICSGISSMAALSNVLCRMRLMQSLALLLLPNWGNSVIFCQKPLIKDRIWAYQSIKMKGLQTLPSIFSPIIMTDTKWDKTTTCLEDSKSIYLKVAGFIPLII